MGDDKYYGQDRQKFTELADKLFLHAYKIDLSGIYNKNLVIKAPLPKYFVEACGALGLNFKE